VIALFHHPLNLEVIPHTNIISRDRQRFAQQLGEFIQREFLSPEPVVMRIREFNSRHAARTVCWRPTRSCASNRSRVDTETGKEDAHA
jgi:uncharacterized membrane-anchored protein YjiN (DUF445 family)